MQGTAKHNEPKKQINNIIKEDNMPNDNKSKTPLPKKSSPKRTFLKIPFLKKSLPKTPPSKRPLPEIPEQQSAFFNHATSNQTQTQNTTLEESLYAEPIDNVKSTEHIYMDPADIVKSKNHIEESLYAEPIDIVKSKNHIEESLYAEPIDNVKSTEHIYMDPADIVKSKNYIHKTTPKSTNQQRQNYHKTQFTKQTDPIKSTTNTSPDSNIQNNIRQKASSSGISKQ